MKRRLREIREAFKAKVERMRAKLARAIGQAARKRDRRLEKVRDQFNATKISDRGLRMIGTFEGFRSTPYNDAAGHATIGYGHLIHYGPVTPADVRAWGELDRDEALDLLRADVGVALEAVVDRVKVRLRQYELDALVSFTFNVGTGAFAGSTLLEELNAGHRDRVPAELNRWTKAGGSDVAGLVTRRRLEGELFAEGNYP